MMSILGYEVLYECSEHGLIEPERRLEYGMGYDPDERDWVYTGFSHSICPVCNGDVKTIRKYPLQEVPR